MQQHELHGLVENSNEDYHAGPGISKSKLDAIRISGLNYWDTYINPLREPREYKHCFAVGDGTHKLILEPGTFEQHYAVGFDKSAHPNALDTVADLKKELAGRGLPVSGAKPELIQRLVTESDYPRDNVLALLEQAHNASMGDRQPMPAGDFKSMMAMLKAVNSHHTAPGLLRNAYTEKSFYVTDPKGRLRKCRLDFLTHDGNVIGDIKTTEDVSEEGFGKTIAQRRYHVQAAWYLDILKMLYGDDAPTQFAFIACQKRRPYDVAVHYLTEEQIALGRLLYQEDLARLDECERTGVWPGMDGGKVVAAKIPYWEMRRLEAA